MENNNFNLKNVRFSGKGSQLLHIYIYIHVMKICKMLISYVHTLYSIKYGRLHMLF